jgi:ribosomal-protein-alanine N-acetyltransferase
MVELKIMHKLSYIIRPMQEGDIPQIAEIDREAFSGEWMFRSYASYKRDLDNPLARYVAACIENESNSEPNPSDTRRLPWFKRFLSLNHPQNRRLRTTECIIGFAGIWLMLKEAHIIAIAVRNNYRRIGIGEGLLISIIDLATQLNANSVTLEVRASNEVAQALYKKYGFQLVGRRHNYYSDNCEDALLMKADDIASAPFQACFQQLRHAHAQRHVGISRQLL